MGLLQKFFGIENMLPKGMEHEELPSGKSMYGEYIRMAIPSVLEMVLISLINMADTVMVSSVGTDAVAAVGLVGQPRMLMLCFFFALNMGITAVVARRKGEGRRDEANRVVRNAILLILGMVTVVLAVMLPLAEPLMRFAGAEAGRTLEDATAYFLIVGSALPFNALSMAICAAQRGVGNTRLTMIVNITSNLVNIVCNYLLINPVHQITIGPLSFTMWGAGLGVRGAAIATAIGMVVGFALALISIMSTHRKDTFLVLSFRENWKLNKQTVTDVVKIALSAMLEQVAMRIGFFSYAKIVAGLGTDSFAAHQIAMQFLNLSFSCADGLGIAGTSLVGQMLGRKRKDLAHIYGTLAQRFAFLVSLLIAACCVVFRYQLVSMFISENANPGVRELAETIMIIVGVFQPFQMLSTVVSGSLRGAGDVKYTARVMMLTVAIMRPLLALLCVYLIGNVMHMNEVALIGAWVASLADMVTRMILFMKRYRSGGWHNIRV